MLLYVLLFYVYILCNLMFYIFISNFLFMLYFMFYFLKFLGKTTFLIYRLIMLVTMTTPPMSSHVKIKIVSSLRAIKI